MRLKRPPPWLAWPLAEEVGDKALEGRSEFAPLLKAQVAGFISEGWPEPNRNPRPDDLKNRFGTKAYAAEELIALS